jgi:integrase
MDRRLAARRLDCALIFHRTSHRRLGQPVRDFRKLWSNALAAASLPDGLLPHDLRRTALRNMIRGGTTQAVAMKISGNRTILTFLRYNITSTEDIEAEITRTAAYVATLPTERNVANIEDSQKTHNRVTSRKAR